MSFKAGNPGCACCEVPCTCAYVSEHPNYKDWVPTVGTGASLQPNYNCRCLDADDEDGQVIPALTVELSGTGTYTDYPHTGGGSAAACTAPAGGCGDWTGVFAVPCGITNFMKVYLLCDTLGFSPGGAALTVRVWAAQLVRFTFRAANSDLANVSTAFNDQKSLTVELFSGFLAQTTNFGGTLPANIYAAWEDTWDESDSPTSPAFTSALQTYTGFQLYSTVKFADNTRHRTYVLKEFDCPPDPCQTPVYLHDCTSAMSLYSGPTLSGLSPYGCVPDNVTVSL